MKVTTFMRLTRGMVLRTQNWLKCCFTSTETVGLLGTGTQDVHLDFHTAPELRGRRIFYGCRLIVSVYGHRFNFFKSAVSGVKEDSADLFLAWERELRSSFLCVP